MNRTLLRSSLLARIFLSYWLAMLLIAAGAIGVTIYLLAERADDPRRDPAVLANEAAHALEAGGEPALKRWLESVNRRQSDLMLLIVNAAGDDLLGRPVPHFLAHRLERQMEMPRGDPGFESHMHSARYHPPQPLPLLVASDGTTYRLALIPRRPGFFGTLGLPEARWTVLLLALVVTGGLSWLLARSVSHPVRVLTSATRSLAAGDLDVRLGPDVGRRRDELGELARDFDDMADKLRQLLRSRERLLRDISHELRSPLARMQVAVALARRSGTGVDQQLDRIESETKRLDALIDQVLKLSRLDAGSAAFHQEAVDLASIVDQVARDAAFEGQAREVTVAWNAPEPIMVRGDADLLASAVENVVRNALRFSPAGARIELLAAVRAGLAHCSVRDYGSGVPEAELERIFEPFYRVAESRSRDSGGDGIGLAITARVMAVHGGTAKARNALGGGLEVELTLPLANPPDAARGP